MKRGRPRYRCRKKKYTPREAHRAVERLHEIQDNMKFEESRYPDERDFMKSETLKARKVRERKAIKMGLLVILGRLTEQKERETEEILKNKEKLSGL